MKSYINTDVRIIIRVTAASSIASPDISALMHGGYFIIDFVVPERHTVQCLPGILDSERGNTKGGWDTV